MHCSEPAAGEDLGRLFHHGGEEAADGAILVTNRDVGEVKPGVFEQSVPGDGIQRVVRLK